MSAPAQRRQRIRPLVNCARCHRDRSHGGRGLCTSCLILAGKDGTREQYPRSTRRRRTDTVEDLHFLLGRGMGIREIAAQLHVTEQYLHELKRGAK